MLLINLQRLDDHIDKIIPCPYFCSIYMYIMQTHPKHGTPNCIDIGLSYTNFSSNYIYILIVFIFGHQY
ncbi:hypothetical protein V1478_012817 [Vespula squamosa]|uniref:Uncharacterized protein n=1 Tax=Vespula squamosa TaxID=30214 RepID=A0ABD2A969_VESSQ